jgi:hypothetical protein
MADLPRTARTARDPALVRAPGFRLIVGRTGLNLAGRAAGPCPASAADGAFGSPFDPRSIDQAFRGVSRWRDALGVFGK